MRHGWNKLHGKTQSVYQEIIGQFVTTYFDTGMHKYGLIGDEPSFELRVKGNVYQQGRDTNVY